MLSEKKTRKKMMEFYTKIKKMDPNCRNIAITVLSGSLFGERALLSDGCLLWDSLKSAEEDFFSENQDWLAQINRTGPAVISGETLYCEILGREKKIVICGGGHVSIPLIQMGRMIGCRVTVLEDRPEFAARAECAGASEIICAPYAESLGKIQGDTDTFFVIVTRGHQYDQICLAHIAKKPHAYIGMIGSRKRTALVKAAVLEAGAPQDVIDRVYTPIGLSIGAETPEEIAIAIAAEIISVKSQNRNTAGYPAEMLEAILQKGELCPKQKVIAVIVARTGSAPRSIGTKMLVFPDGTCIGTIGGGYAEAVIRSQALSMLQTGQTERNNLQSEYMTDEAVQSDNSVQTVMQSKGQKMKLCRIDLAGDVAAEKGMVCGGRLDVLLELAGRVL